MVSQAVIPQMREIGSGRIINIGSTGSLGAEPGFGAYTTMKHGLVGFSKTLAAEFGPDGILCNTVCPGYIATDMHTAENTRLADQRGMSVEQIKKERYANVAPWDADIPENVANAVAYLAGPQAIYVTGINFPVTGGAFLSEFDRGYLASLGSELPVAAQEIELHNAQLETHASLGPQHAFADVNGP